MGKGRDKRRKKQRQMENHKQRGRRIIGMDLAKPGSEITAFVVVGRSVSAAKAVIYIDDIPYTVTDVNYVSHP